MTVIFAASARIIVCSVPAAVVDRPMPTSIANTTPAETLTKPPNSAETAPCQPAHHPAGTAIKTLAKACHEAMRAAG